MGIEHASAHESLSSVDLLQVLRSTEGNRLGELQRVIADASATTTRLGNRPNPADAFVGRRHELRRILRLFCHDGARLVTLH